MSLWSEMRVSVAPHNKNERRKSVRKLIDSFPPLQGQDYSISDVEDCIFVLRLREGGQRAYNMLHSLHEELKKEFKIDYLSINTRFI